ncbi:hypothetical protein [Acetobacter indonesiensis]|uniref:Uncharacterized protein n=1 Tax=Acetobacter indonesiensis TaxID=104101 RepID=A0A252AUS3_9PROT|nr:hypothetical protein [Acetobacter indonesiensis]OUI93972.1 hypothetical protein HK17_06770 [Acetobacter indonesiensis]
MSETVLDELVIRLGLDTSGLQTSAQQALGVLDKLEQKTNDLTDKNQKTTTQIGNRFTQLQKQAIGLLGLISAGRGVSDILKQSTLEDHTGENTRKQNHSSRKAEAKFATGLTRFTTPPSAFRSPLSTAPKGLDPSPPRGGEFPFLYYPTQNNLTPPVSTAPASTSLLRQPLQKRTPYSIPASRLSERSASPRVTLNSTTIIARHNAQPTAMIPRSVPIISAQNPFSQPNSLHQLPKEGSLSQRQNERSLRQDFLLNREQMGAETVPPSDQSPANGPGFLSRQGAHPAPFRQPYVQSKNAQAPITSSKMPRQERQIDQIRSLPKLQQFSPNGSNQNTQQSDRSSPRKAHTPSRYAIERASPSIPFPPDVRLPGNARNTTQPYLADGAIWRAAMVPQSGAAAASVQNTTHIGPVTIHVPSGNPQDIAQAVRTLGRENSHTLTSLATYGAV